MACVMSCCWGSPQATSTPTPAGIEMLRATLGRTELETAVRAMAQRARVERGREERGTGRQAMGQLVRALWTERRSDQHWRSQGPGRGRTT